MKKFLIKILYAGSAAFLFCTAPLHSQNQTYRDILEFRYKNDPDYTLMENEAKIAKNNYKAALAGALLSVNLTTGNINLTLTSDKEKKSFSIDPKASVNMPLFNNAGIKISAPYSSSSGGKEVQRDFSASVSADFYSQVRNKAKLQIEEAGDALKAAEKKRNMSGKLIEKKLLTDIKNIFAEYSKLLSKKHETVKADINYRQVQAQGYSENSAKLRTARLSLLSAQREEKEADFSFSVSAKLFFDSCGIRTEEKDFETFFTELAYAVPKNGIVSIDNLTADNYSKIIEAEKLYKRTVLKNRINLNPLTITGEAGFSMQNKRSTVMTGRNSASVSKEKKSVQGGLTFAVPGIKLYAGVDIPIADKDQNPAALKLAFSVNPISIYEYSLKRKNANLMRINEKIKLDELKKNFENDFKTFSIEKEKYGWQQTLYAEELGIYRQNAEDHKKWFSQGVVNGSENMQADLEYKKALIRYAESNINVNIFNVKVEELFDY